MIGCLKEVDTDVGVVVTAQCEAETRVLLHPCYGSKSANLPLKYDGLLSVERKCGRSERVHCINSGVLTSNSRCLGRG